MFVAGGSSISDLWKPKADVTHCATNGLTTRVEEFLFFLELFSIEALRNKALRIGSDSVIAWWKSRHTRRACTIWRSGRKSTTRAINTESDRTPSIVSEKWNPAMTE